MAKVMLVEDDNNLREIYEARLQAEGYTIVAAKDGEEALAIAKVEKPDLIISDVMMPKISGFEMLDILRNTDGLKDVKVIMLTALGQSDDQQRADKLGADKYLVKSQVTLEDIVKVAHELLEDGGGESAPVASVPAAPAPVPPENPAPATPAPVAPTPVASAPAPEPVAAAPAVVPEPASSPADTASSAQSTAQEEASVEAQIEDFVAGATTEATPAVEPAAATAAEAAATDTPPAEPAVEPQPEAAAAKDDQLLAEATDTLAADAEKNAAPPPLAPTPAVEPAPEPVAEAKDVSSNDKPDNDNVEIAHKKVINPIDSDPKKDINTLLAVEEAKEAASQGPPPPTAVISTPETGEQATPLTGAPDEPVQATEFAVEKNANASQEAGEQSDSTVDPGTVAL